MRNEKGGKTVTGIVLTALSLILTGNIIAVMTHRIKTVERPVIYKKNLFADMMLCSTLFISSLDIAFNLFTRSGNALLRFLGWIVRISFFVPSVIVLFFSGKIVAGSLIKHKRHAKYAIVLGMALEKGKPTKDLLYRVETAKKYLETNPGATLILTGGVPDRNGKTEAEVMRLLLLERGIPEEKIILEDRSDSTKTNFKNTLEIIDATTPVVLITSNYHMDRAVRIAKKAGFKNVLRLPASTSFFPYASNVMWEVLHNINEYTKIVKDT
ncbi:MAG: YdcF family protein [Lachnospiraceae bacterium]|nr:YdcF family protein [Lachnospiraceae bacterium]